MHHLIHCRLERQQSLEIVLAVSSLRRSSLIGWDHRLMHLDRTLELQSLAWARCFDWTTSSSGYCSVAARYKEHLQERKLYHCKIAFASCLNHFEVFFATILMCLQVSSWLHCSEVYFSLFHQLQSCLHCLKHSQEPIPMPHNYGNQSRRCELVNWEQKWNPISNHLHQ